MKEAALSNFAHQLPMMRISTLRVLIQFLDCLEEDAAELVVAEMIERQNQIVSKRRKDDGQRVSSKSVQTAAKDKAEADR